MATITRTADLLIVEHPTGERHLYRNWRETIEEREPPPPRAKVRILPDDLPWEPDDLVRQEMQKLLT